ncbi:MAG: hypothetical protein RhofKO_26930 [Rhodothermales bacterium]
MKSLLLLAGACLLLTPAHAQSTDEGLPASARPEGQALRVDAPPLLDGLVLTDPVWQTAVPLTTFWQTTPNEGDPATEGTEVRLAFDDNHLYIGVVLYDREPEAIIVSDSRRDASLDETDSFRFIIDTYQDGQNGFVFGTNPAGIEYDGQVTNEGQGSFGGPNRQAAGSGAGFNINWDGAWEVATQITDDGWSAEFVIPFKTLRYPSAAVQQWGINFQRNIRRRNERSFWAPLPRQFGLNRVSMAGTMSGVEPPPLRNLKIMPYMLGEVREGEILDPETNKYAGNVGGDLKYSITPSLTLDATVNTDFAQVEVDEQQINLDRFSLFFPEKRPFFLENAGLFSVGVSGEVDLFFSRRIGIGASGEEIPIIGGARMSGNVGKLGVGFLNMQTDAENGVASNNFTVARVRKELPNRSALGALVTNRLGMGDLAGDDNHNQTVAVDGRVGIGQYGLVSGFASLTNTPNLDGGNHAVNLDARYHSERWLLNATYTEIGRNFNPEVGFLSRSAYRKPTFLIFHTYRPDDLIGLHEMRPHVSYRGYWDFDGFQETGFLHVDNHWEWKSGFEVHTGINFTREGVKTPFTISDGVTVPAGTYDHQEAMIVLFTNQGRKVSINNRFVAGGFFGGDRVSLSSTLRLRANEAFTSEFGVQYNDISLPNGDFKSNLYRARLSYAFTPRIYLQSLLQYNDAADLWSANLRFGWLQAANTGLFIVFNETNEFDALYDGPRYRSFIIKYSRVFDVLR